MGLRKVLYLLVFSFVTIDQISKYIVEQSLPFQSPVQIIPFFSLYRTYNTGIAFSMLNWAGSGGLVVLALIVLALMFYLWSKVSEDKQLAHIGFALVVGGAIGNLIDRISRGHVVDFLLLHTEKWSFAVFNLADAFITVGAIAIIIDEIFSFRNQQKPVA